MVDYLLRASYKEKTTLYQRSIELPVDLILCLIRKVYEYIPAYDNVAACRIRILQQIVFLEFNVALDLISYLVGITYLGEIFLLEFLRNTRDTLLIIQSGLGLCYYLLVKICSKDLDLAHRNML